MSSFPQVRTQEGTLDLARRVVRDGTPAMAAGTVVAGLAAYGFQILGGRTLGESGFAPVAVLLTVHSLILAVLLTPVELLTVRRLTLVRGGQPDEDTHRAIAVTVLASVTAMVVFIASTTDRYFGGNDEYVIVGAVVVLTHAFFALGRGALAGQGRYLAYGTVSGTAAVLRLLLAFLWIQLSATDMVFAWAIAIPPLIIAVWWPFRRTPRISAPARVGTGTLMTGFVLAGAISQAFVLAGPLVAGAIESDPAAVGRTISVVFVTFSLARAPLLLAQNLAARLLAGFTRIVAEGSHRELRTWTRRLGVAGLAGIPVGYLAGSTLGTPVIARLFGEAFRPTATFAGLAVAGCVVASASVFLDQALVARGETGRLAAAWGTALLLAGATLLAVDGAPAERVGWAVLVGEVAALALVVAAAERLAGLSTPLADVAKRTFDLAIGFVMIVLTLPLMAMAVLAIRADSTGPATFRQTRIGRHGVPFSIVKFRTMRTGADDAPLQEHLVRVAVAGPIPPDIDATGPDLWIDDDPRVTRVGRILRATSLDELPNLWNVLAGRMSLVGPRPLVPEEAALLDAVADRRHEVRPGMTGLAQVEGRSDMTFGERAHWDLEYVERRTMLLDLWILLRTPMVAFTRR